MRTHDAASTEAAPEAHSDRRLRPLAAAVLCASLPGAVLGAPDSAPVLRTLDEPPPGFEVFFQRQATVVDVYYAGRFLTTARASFDVDDLTFDDPAALVERLPDLQDPERVTAALTGELATHSERICGRVLNDSCGRLDADDTGVIFDASRFRADLFVARTQIVAQRPEIDRFLPESDARFSALQNFAAAYSGADDSGDSWNLQSVTSLSWGETHLQMDSAWNDNDDFTVDQLALRREFRGRSAQAGLFRTRGQSIGFVRDRDIVGVRFGSSLQTRADQAFSNGTPVAVFLPERARIEVFQDGRLLTSDAYEAGNRILDTSGLPEGAYEIELRIREIGGRERVERRFFVKTTRIPPADQPLWSFELGRVVDRNTNGALPEDTGEVFARGSYTRRISDGIGIDLATATTEGEGLLEIGAYRLDQLTEVQVAAFASNDGDYGTAGFGRLRAGTLNATLDWRIVRGPQLGAVDPLVGARLDQYGLTFSSALGGGRLAITARYDDRGDRSTSSQGLSWDRYLSRGAGDGIRLSFDISRQDDDWVGFTSIQYDFRGANTFGELEPALRYDEQNGNGGDIGLQTRGRVAWEQVRARGDLMRLGLSGIGGVTENRVGGDGLVEGRYGVLGGQIDRDFEGGGRSTWTGQFNTSLLSDGRSLSVGGRDRARSAALIAIDGDVPGARFEVLVDDFVQGIAPAGSVTPIHLRPWQSYTVRLRPIGEKLLAWENRERTITLYPGNVVRLEWDVAEVVVLLGRLVDEDGEPIENARLGGAYGFAMSETAGLFQAEVVKPQSDDGPIRLEVTDRDGVTCAVEVDLSGLTERRGIYRVGSRTCAR